MEEKRADSQQRMGAPTRMPVVPHVLGYPEAAKNAPAGANSSSATPTHASPLDWREQQTTVSMSQSGSDSQPLRACAYPLPLRPIAMESPLVAQQRRAQYPGSTHQQLRWSLAGSQLFSPGRPSPCTPTTSGSPLCALSHSPLLSSSVVSGRSGCAGSDMLNGSGVSGRGVQSGGVRTTVLPRNGGVVGRTPAFVGASAVAAGEAAAGVGHLIPGPRKFSPNVDVSKSSGSSVKHEGGLLSATCVKEESTGVRHLGFGTEEGLLTRMLLQSSRSNTKGTGETKASTTRNSGCPSNENVCRSHGGHNTGAAGIANNSAELPASMRTSARIMESNIRLLQEQLRSSKEGCISKERKSKDLLELSWIGGNMKEQNGMGGVYTPLTLPFVVKEEAEEEDDEHREDRTPDEADRTKKRSRNTRRPTARHVEEANRFAAGLLLVEDDRAKSAGGASSDTWDLADDEGSESIEFLHICFPFALPPLDRQAMMEAEELRHQQIKRSDSGSTTDSKDGREHSGLSSCSDTSINNRAKGSLPKVPLQPSPPLRLPELPAGRIGRLLVHRSGRVKLRLLSSNSKQQSARLEKGAAESFSKKENTVHTSASQSMAGGATASRDVSAKEPLETVSGNVGVRAGKTTPRLRRVRGADNGVSFEVNVGSECTFAQMYAREAQGRQPDMSPRPDTMEIPDLGEICLNVEASKVSAAFSQITDVLRHLNEKQERLANQLAALSEKLTGTEDLQKQLASVEEGNAKSIDQLKTYTQELEALKLEEQTKTMGLHSQQFEKTLQLLEQSDLKWKEQDAKLAQLSIDSRQTSASLENMAADVCGLKSTLETHKTAVAQVQTGHAECAERCCQIEEVQYRLQESVASKYQKLWQDVVEALEKVNAAELSNYQQELKKSVQHSEQRVQQLVSYALNLVAEAARNRRSVDLKRSVVLRWKETAWLGARQRMACRVLERFFRSHCGKHFRDVRHVIAWETQISRMKQEFQACLPNMDKVVQNLVQPAVIAIEEKRVASESMMQQIQQQVEQLTVHTRGLQLREDFENVLTRSNSDEERSNETRVQMNEVIEQMSQVARQDEMQGIMKDILLIWTAVKQLDATKADKRDLDSLATETSTRGQNTELKLKHLESFWSEQHQALQGQVSGAEEKLHDTNSRSRMLNFMLGVLMRFMEDVVKKILSLDPSRPMYAQAGRGGTVIRTGGGWLPHVSTGSSAQQCAHSRPCSPPCCRTVSPSLVSTENASSHSFLGGTTGNAEKHATPAGIAGHAGRYWRALPTSRSLENTQVVTLEETQDDKRGTQDFEGVSTHDWKSTTVASNQTECTEISNPAVRAFCDWVERVRAVFEAPATLGVCVDPAAATDANPGVEEPGNKHSS